MADSESVNAFSKERIAISPSLASVTDVTQVPPQSALIDRRTLQICIPAILLGLVAGVAARILIALIALFTNVAFFGRFSFTESSPADAVGNLGWFVVVIPIIGAVLVGLMARYGSKAIRGHGIPEAMEQILTNESRIPARIVFLKPLSSAVSIGTGGPFGAEGPIIATGGALGSVFGQFLSTTTAERKTLLAAGAAAGMAATFGSPIAAVLLAIELLLFEYRPRSIIPVALAATAATAMRMFFEGSEPAFAMSNLTAPSGLALSVYVLLGGLMGVVAVLVTRIVYGIEDAFERLPIHWMWWPAVGAIAVGLCGYFAPNTLGVGYYNISDLLSNKLTVSAIAFLCAMKFISWSIALGSGTSGGTLAPLFTIGGALGSLMGSAIATLVPALGISTNMAALVGMAALFAGASRALLASAVFAFETTLQPLVILPLLGGCAAAYLVSSLLMNNSIMTEKIARRGVSTPGEYLADVLDQVFVRDVASKNVVTLHASNNLAIIRKWISSGAAETSHQGFPVINDAGTLVGVVTRKQFLDPGLSDETTIGDLVGPLVKYVYDDCTVRQAADHMVNHHIGRLPVVRRDGKPELIGIITRSDILSVFRKRLGDHTIQAPSLRWPANQVTEG